MDKRSFITIFGAESSDINFADFYIFIGRIIITSLAILPDCFFCLKPTLQDHKLKPKWS